MARAIVIHVYGDVQGVGFRARIRHIANAFNLNGYVKNMPDGSVEIYVEGDEQSIEAFTETVKNLREYEIWEVKTEETVPKGYLSLIHI